jgi:hypothetical protein
VRLPAKKFYLIQNRSSSPLLGIVNHSNAAYLQFLHACVS